MWLAADFETHLREETAAMLLLAFTFCLWAGDFSCVFVGEVGVYGVTGYHSIPGNERKNTFHSRWCSSVLFTVLIDWQNDVF